ncbi:hypothetical protein C5B42_03105 [Candidatus Cerribacteria bacterium 'Amazon FNV 2010 28 9']|uniref:Uncharacterized protein n=1 Tax=Candidatus Cerribacteria bacterium 'Amazon FNV 2010 28 9' TaxID=2081795 RepID=A0A317JRE1_9BACT|nr:MAG: hypothetical protein C5B42_03105 [Candidatus Cerribacteria bacterium 'Amazon FNV 2010 28 9']
MSGVRIETLEDIARIPIRSERLFAVAMLCSGEFDVFWRPGELQGAGHVTSPDFYLQEAENPNGGVYVEVTETLLKNFGERKKRQRRTLQNSGEVFWIVDRLELEQRLGMTIEQADLWFWDQIARRTVEELVHHEQLDQEEELEPERRLLGVHYAKGWNNRRARC